MKATEKVKNLTDDQLKQIVRELISLQEIGTWQDDHNTAKAIIKELCDEHKQGFNLNLGEAFIKDEVYKRFVK